MMKTTHATPAAPRKALAERGLVDAQGCGYRGHRLSAAPALERNARLVLRQVPSARAAQVLLVADRAQMMRVDAPSMRTRVSERACRGVVAQVVQVHADRNRADVVFKGPTVRPRPSGRAVDSDGEGSVAASVNLATPYPTVVAVLPLLDLGPKARLVIADDARCSACERISVSVKPVLVCRAETARGDRSIAYVDRTRLRLLRRRGDIGRVPVTPPSPPMEGAPPSASSRGLTLINGAESRDRGQSLMQRIPVLAPSRVMRTAPSACPQSSRAALDGAALFTHAATLPGAMI